MDVIITLSKNAVGAKLLGEEFEFELFYNDESSGEPVVIDTSMNDRDGFIRLQATFDEEGEYNYFVRETSSPQGWEIDDTEYPVVFNVVEVAGELECTVSYPEGIPGFRNTLRGENCGLVEFPELTFAEPGDYEYILKELTPSGDGWTTDESEITVIVHVTDDGHGNLLATLEYPGDAFPEFTNSYEAAPVKIVISACKIAVGAELPAGRFEFGLYGPDGELVSTARNE